MTIRVLIADDQALVRNGIAMILDHEDDIEIVGEADDGSGAVDLAASLAPDIVLMDVQMPMMDGLVATRRITKARGEGAAPQVVILTTFERDDYLFEALRAGASGFLLKSAGADELVTAVRTVAAGDALLAPSVTRRIVDHFVQGPVDPATVRRLEQLTERELEVLRQVATGRTNAEISQELFVSEATTKTHVSRILAKLGLRDRVQMVVFAYESGLVRSGSD